MARRDRRRDCRRGSDWSPGPASPLPTRLAWGRHADAGGGGSGSTSELRFLWGRGRTEHPFSEMRLRVSLVSGPPARGSREKGGRAARARSLGAGGCPLPTSARLPPLPTASPAGIPGRERRGSLLLHAVELAADFLLKVMVMVGGGLWQR